MICCKSVGGVGSVGFVAQIFDQHHFFGPHQSLWIHATDATQVIFFSFAKILQTHSTHKLTNPRRPCQPQTHTTHASHKPRLPTPPARCNRMHIALKLFQFLQLVYLPTTHAILHNSHVYCNEMKINSCEFAIPAHIIYESAHISTNQLKSTHDFMQRTTCKSNS